jgi:hypothetical protein
VLNGVNGCQTLARSRLSGGGEDVGVGNGANGGATSIAPARAQPLMPPLLTPREPGHGETLLVLTSLEPGSVPPHAPHGLGPSARTVYQTTKNCIRQAWPTLMQATNHTL